MVALEELFYARIKKIEFVNFRNIECGVVDFPHSKPEDFISENPSILGLYGQNGSGKSSVIMALGMLKTILSGKTLSDNYMSCIRYGCERCTLKFTFVMYVKLFDSDGSSVISPEDSQCYDVFYEFDIAKSEEDFDNVNGAQQLIIENEIIRLRYMDSLGNVIFPKQILIDTRYKESDAKGRAFGNEKKHASFTGNNSEIIQKLRELKAIAKAQSKSFVFTPKVIKLLEEGTEISIQNIKHFQDILDRIQSVSSLDELEPNGGEYLEWIEWHRKALYIKIIESLQLFGNSYLHVIDTTTTGLTNINIQLPLLLWNVVPGVGVYNMNIQLQMDGPTHVAEKMFLRMKHSLMAVSDVLNKIIPGLTLDFKDLGIRLAADNTEEHYFEMLSNREGVVSPLKYESDGIRRIVSILSLLIAAYNEASFTVAIDEIDSGIFEYLLGEILMIMSDSVKGQLIFTSHNLRPLEVLPAKYLCFTTTNPNDRFVKIANKGNSNMRDSYFRNIILGGGKEAVYKPTDRYEIEMAFYRAGHYGEE